MRVSAAAAALVAAVLAGAAQAAPAPTHSYEFSGNLADDLGGPSMALNPGAPSAYSGSGVTQGFEFGINNGPNLSGAFASSEVYSMEMFFSLDSIGSGYRRLVDFKNGSTDHGLYYLGDSLVMYNTGVLADVNATQDRLTHLVLTRDATAAFKVYFNGQLALDLANDGGRGVLSGPDRIVRFFDDDGGEASSGFVDFIRTYDQALTQADVTALYNDGALVRVDGGGAAVPEPGAWALMILGFGAAGAVLRTRRRVLAA